MISKCFAEFVEKIKAGQEDAFLILKDDNRFLRFVVTPFGKAKMIYGEYTYGNITEMCSPSSKLEVVAYYVDGYIYLVNQYIFDMYGYDVENDDNLPDKVVFFEAARKSKNSYIEKILLPKYLDGIPARTLEGTDVARAKAEARSRILLPKPDTSRNSQEASYYLTQNDFAQSLCGLVEANRLAWDKMEKYREAWSFIKAYSAKVEEFKQDPSITTEEERIMSNALNSIDAQNVRVEFCVNGKSTEVKMDPDLVLRHLNERDYFSKYNFTPRRAGEELFKVLDATDSRWDKSGKPLLTCDCIQKIMYGRNTIYERGANK